MNVDHPKIMNLMPANFSYFARHLCEHIKMLSYDDDGNSVLDFPAPMLRLWNDNIYGRFYIFAPCYFSYRLCDKTSGECNDNDNNNNNKCMAMAAGQPSITIMIISIIYILDIIAIVETHLKNFSSKFT